MRKSIENWRAAWGNGTFRSQLFVSLAATFVAVAIMRMYLDYVGDRRGVAFPDPILAVVPPIDLNWVIFVVFYSGMLLGIFTLLTYPMRLLVTMRALILMILFRMVCLFVLPLDPSPGSIALIDPIVPYPLLRFTSPRGLFFCWETATLALLAMTARWNDLKVIFGAGTVLISLLLLFQHAQYTFAVVAAPCFAFAAYGIARHFTVKDIAEISEKR